MFFLHPKNPKLLKSKSDMRTKAFFVEQYLFGQDIDSVLANLSVKQNPLGTEQFAWSAKNVADSTVFQSSLGPVAS